MALSLASSARELAIKCNSINADESIFATNGLTTGGSVTVGTNLAVGTNAVIAGNVSAANAAITTALTAATVAAPTITQGGGRVFDETTNPIRPSADRFAAKAVPVAVGASNADTQFVVPADAANGTFIFSAILSFGNGLAGWEPGPTQWLTCSLVNADSGAVVTGSQISFVSLGTPTAGSNFTQTVDCMVTLPAGTYDVQIENLGEDAAEITNYGAAGSLTFRLQAVVSSPDFA